jgi:hypothetical protein
MNIKYSILWLALLFFSACKTTSQPPNERYTIRFADLSFSVSANGGRVVSFQRDGHELLLSDSVHPRYYGATLWLSPQSRFWPQPSTLDKKAYRVTKHRNSLRLTSETDSLTGFRFIKEFEIVRQDTSVLVNYIIENHSDSVQHVAAWDVTRVAGGITSFPLKEKNLPGLSSDLANISTKDGVLYYTFSQDSLAGKQKLFATTSEGWLAHQSNHLLFIKSFPQVAVNDLPPLQGEVEIFLAPNSLYVELENHGPYTRLEKGESLTYRQKWRLLSL